MLKQLKLMFFLWKHRKHYVSRVYMKRDANKAFIGNWLECSCGKKFSCD